MSADPVDRSIDRLREMFGIESTIPEEVWAAVEKYDAHNLRTIERLRDHAQMMTRLGQMEHAASGRWQEMAEDLWEELQEWHDEGCPSLWTAPAVPGDCTCHRILAAKWDEITHADDWSDDDLADDEEPQP